MHGTTMKIKHRCWSTKWNSWKVFWCHTYKSFKYFAQHYVRSHGCRWYYRAFSRQYGAFQAAGNETPVIW